MGDSIGFCHPAAEVQQGDVLATERVFSFDPAAGEVKEVGDQMRHPFGALFDESEGVAVVVIHVG